MADEPQVEAPAAVQKGGMLRSAGKAAGLFVLVLAAVLIGGAINARLHPVQELVVGPDGRLTLKAEPKQEGAKEKPHASGPALYYAFDPPLVVNFEQNGTMRFLQVGVDVLARDEDVIKAVQQNAPLIRNNLTLLMSNLDYQEVMTRDGKEKLRAAALAEVRKVVKREAGKDGPEDLLFTSFVVQ